jgi:hypothetical protein
MPQASWIIPLDNPDTAFSSPFKDLYATKKQREHGW